MVCAVESLFLRCCRRLQSSRSLYDESKPFMKASPKSRDIARALSAAFDPLIDVCLDIGVTSPELESLLRAAFVKRATVKLPRETRGGVPASINKVSMATGVNRNEVSSIRRGSATAKQTLETKERLYSKSAKVLNGWTTDPRFATSGGQPLDLPMERNRQRRSFEDLVAKFAPGTYHRTVLKELKRRGNVTVLADDIIRLKSMTVQPKGITAATVAKTAQRMNRLGSTLLQRMLEPEQARLYEETGQFVLNAEQLRILRPVLEQRARVFLKGIEAEFGRQRTQATPDARSMAVSVFAWEDK